MAQTSDFWLKLPTLIFSMFSLIGSIYVCSSSFMLRCLRKRVTHLHHSSKPIVLTHLLFWLSFGDIMINIWILITWIPPAIIDETHVYPPTTCQIIGAFGQFFLVASSCFYCVIIYITWTMMAAAYATSSDQGRRSTIASAFNFKKNGLNNIPYHRLTEDFHDNQSRYFSNASSSVEQKREALTEKLNKIVMSGGKLTLILSVILTMVPYIGTIHKKYHLPQTDCIFYAGNSYGYMRSVEDDMFVCWITDHFYQLTLYIPVAIYILFALILTLHSLCQTRKISKRMDSRKKSKKWKLIQRLLAFTFIFVMTWLFPLLYWSLMTISTGSDPPFSLMVLQHLSFGCIGFGNSIIWLRSTSFQSCGKSMKQYKNNKRNMDVNSRISQRIKRLVTGTPED